MSAFHPKLGILPPAQRRLWDELADVPSEFTLYSGTAVALHLGHRESVDFNFFGRTKFAPLDLAMRVPFLKGAAITQTEPNTLSVVVDRDGPVKLSFFGMPNIMPIKEPHVASDNGIHVASLLDLAGMKAAVIQQRAEAKDYIDIDAILSDGQVTLPMALTAAVAIYGMPFVALNTLKALTYFEEAELRYLPLALKHRLVAAVREYDQHRNDVAN